MTGEITSQSGDGLERQTPPEDAPAEPAVCSYCGARFADDELLALHRGLEHESELTEAEREAYVEAVASEREDVKLFRLKALVALLVLYFGFIFVYAFVL
ncbi:C2H2-type zinc finger protein [Natronomonas salina]|uniref:C2H2-type zinc finger protein n=1 Tax=Natronomonas salina TaxID=1710540 RepID=UPI0015B651B4|nr:C2H2-type zinc finger protein [Natronomonas salina]QLD88415.1 C2H2-type zinc finger protein [Natronomonas salina]